MRPIPAAIRSTQKSVRRLLRTCAIGQADPSRMPLARRVCAKELMAKFSAGVEKFLNRREQLRPPSRPSILLGGRDRRRPKAVVPPHG